MSRLTPTLSGSPEYALITGGEEVPHTLEISLSAGLAVRRCRGPSDVHCPVAHGDPCLLREQAKVAVVYLGEHEMHTSGRWECLVGGRSPAVAVLEGQRHRPRAKNGFGLVGSDRGAKGVLAAVAALFDNPDD